MILILVRFRLDSSLVGNHSGQKLLTVPRLVFAFQKPFSPSAHFFGVGWEPFFASLRPQSSTIRVIATSPPLLPPYAKPRFWRVFWVQYWRIFCMEFGAFLSGWDGGGECLCIRNWYVLQSCYLSIKSCSWQENGSEMDTIFFLTQEICNPKKV